MPEPDGVTLARLDERVKGLVADVAELSAEQQRSRSRLHQLEGVAGTLVDVNKERQLDERRREQRLSRRLSTLTVAIAGLALVEPFLYHLATGR